MMKFGLIMILLALEICKGAETSEWGIQKYQDLMRDLQPLGAPSARQDITFGLGYRCLLDGTGERPAFFEVDQNCVDCRNLASRENNLDVELQVKCRGDCFTWEETYWYFLCMVFVRSRKLTQSEVNHWQEKIALLQPTGGITPTIPVTQARQNEIRELYEEHILCDGTRC
ncbi:unnamed protein product [Meganyctiphanes norvegica]|uniref:Uncharacterized protein n=1 Tax=Meganyctiphanes norvegica TaxID=48144 RepID=A0AAV2SSS9_MEGNR